MNNRSNYSKERNPILTTRKITTRYVSCVATTLTLAALAPLAQAAPGSFENLNWGSNNATSTNGYLDVTKAPYFLKNTGNASDAATNSSALQDAIDFAHEQNWAIFFPAGTYVVNRTFNCFNAKEELTDAHVFVGSAAGERPVIKLKDGTFTTASSNGHKPIINYYCSLPGDGTGGELPGAGYNFVFRGIDFDLGSNPGAVAIDLLAAQGCTIQDVDIYSSNGTFWAGIKDLSGSGSVSGNILIDGGKYAFYVTDSKPAPVLIGITCLNQTTRAFYTKMYTPLTIAGFKIVATHGPVFDIAAANDNEHLMLIDGSIEITGNNATIIKNKDRAVYLRNVYTKNANKISDNIQGADLTDNTGGWAHVGEYSYFHVANRRLIETTTSNGAYGASSLDTNSVEPPSDLLSRHIWDEATFPHFEMSGSNLISVGPGSNDTGTINQAIIDAENAGHNNVFLEKGDYYLNGSINLRRNTTLFGVSRNITRLHCDSSWTEAGNAYKPMITTPNDPDASCTLAWLAVAMPKDQAKKIIFTDWQAGRHSMVREVHFRKEWSNKTHNDMKRIKITNNGGGRWYGLWARAGRDGENANHRMLLVENTTEPLSFYCWTVEYQLSLTYMSEFKNAQNITIYGLKCETDLNHVRETPILGITNNSSNIVIYGESGSGELDTNSTNGLIEIKGNSDDILGACLTGGWGNNTNFYIIKNFDDNVGIKKSNGGHGQPVQLYKKGNPNPIAYTPPSGGGGGGSGGTDSISFNVTPPTNVDQGGQVNITVDWSSTGPAHEVEVRLMQSASPWNSQSDTVILNVGSGSGTDTFPMNINGNADTTANALRWRIRLLDGQGTSGANQVVSNVVHQNVTAYPAANTAPDLATITNKSVDEGSNLQIGLSATDADNDNITLSSTNLPSFVTLTDNSDGTCHLTASPNGSDSGIYNITVTANDGNGGTDDEAFILTVNDTPLNNSIAFNVTPPSNVDQGGQYNIDVDWESSNAACEVEVQLMLSSSPWSAQSNTVTLNVGAGSGTDSFAMNVNADADTTPNGLRWRVRLLDGQGTSSSNEVVSNLVHLNVTATPGTLYENDCMGGNSPNVDFDSISGDISNWTYTGGDLKGASSWSRMNLTEANASSWTDYTFNIDIRNSAGATGKNVACALVRCAGGENYYAVLIDANNILFVGKKVDGNWTWESGGACSVDFMDYNLSIDVSGSSIVTIEIYVDGLSTPSMTYTDSELDRHTSGGMGLEVRGNNVFFDNIVVDD